eukprot:TRINITY_DN3144_c0_g1_i1.p1 TRINITY_DN3144_c0_g1~~TRINITY_DN3144_c0_g1_i1.p1  ORF type:complete len:469 (+),score=48.13 TRINITY_DN3144_c0_g1_i1:25-1431(+)
MMRSILRIFITWALDTTYLLVYIITLGTVTIHEGKFSKLLHTYANWNQDYFAQPKRFVAPRTEEEIRDLIKKASKVRAVGGGHSFNGGTLCDTLMLSLDNYNKITNIDHNKKIVKAQAGIRLRTFMKELEAVNLCLPTLGSTNAQSLGGLVASDLHGTRCSEGYLSDQILSVRLVDAAGNIHTLRKGSQEMSAVCGAIGALGVVIEVEIQCVPLYRLSKKITIVESKIVEQDIQKLLEKHDHLSFYYIGGVKLQTCRMNTWDQTDEATSFLYKWRHFIQEIFDFFLCSFILGIGRFTKALDKFGPIGMEIMKLFMNRNLVTNAAGSFSRQLFYRHDEIEYGIPREQFNNLMPELLKLLRTEYAYVTIVEVRFGGASTSLLGPGAGRETVFIELAPSLTADPTGMFTAAEKLFKKYDGKPHLGKWTTANPEYMRRVHGKNFDTFLKIRKTFDPKGKFTNAFVAQVFGDP